MSRDSPDRARVDPYGKLLTVDSLPPPDTVRWVAKRKAQVISAIRGGLISRQEACDRYGISVDELISWENLLDEYGPKALRATKNQRYRRAARSIDLDADEDSGPI
ncbi:MAG: DUF1153 domain-containing protein [Lysobacterales bacterium]|nr:MAG: DUF1153 domain-containing protein [Xanthomonadales bacterium]